MDPSDKKLLNAFLLAFFLDPLGVHRFYVGKVGTGLLMLGLTITLIGLLASSIWAFIDWLMLLTGGFRDKEGRLVSQWT